MKIARCRGCNKKVYFVRDREGKDQILDAVAPVFSVSPDFWGFGEELIEKTNRVVRTHFAFVTHFATCRDANKFGKSKKG